MDRMLLSEHRIRDRNVMLSRESREIPALSWGSRFLAMYL